MLTPNAAAKQAKLSRTAIMNAIKEGRLKASRTNRGWQIDPEDFALFIESRGDTSHGTSMPDGVIELRVEVEGLKAKLAAKQEVVDLLKAELERARLPFWRRIF